MATQSYIAEKEAEVIAIDVLLNEIRASLVIEVNHNDGRYVYNENVNHWGTMEANLFAIGRHCTELSAHIGRMRK